MKFLNETLISTAEVLIEGDGAAKKMYIQGIFMQGGVTNKNKRMYPTKTLVRECERYNREVVEQNQALGELNHPERISVDPKEASHRITKMWVEGNNVHGKALILDTPNGRILKALLEGGTRFGVSSRAVGSLKQCEDYNEVQDDFRLSCVDAVLNPSAPDAIVNHIMEGKSFALVENMIVEVNEATEAAILEKHGCNKQCDKCQNKVKEEKILGGQHGKISEEDMLKAFEKMIGAVEPKFVTEMSDYSAEDNNADIQHHRSQMKFHKEMAQSASKHLNDSNKAVSYHEKELHRHLKRSVKEDVEIVDENDDWANGVNKQLSPMNTTSKSPGIKSAEDSRAERDRQDAFPKKPHIVTHHVDGKEVRTAFSNRDAAHKFYSAISSGGGDKKATVHTESLDESREEHTLYAYDKNGNLEHEQNYNGKAAANNAFNKLHDKKAHHSIFVVDDSGNLMSHSENGLVLKRH